jgi:MFS family permease
VLPARRRQLLVVALAFAAMLASGPGQSFLIAVFVDEMIADTGVSRTVFALLYGAATIVSASTVAALGPAADRFGLRAIWVLVAAGLAVACGLASLVSGVVLALVALSLLRAFGQGSFPLVATLLVARGFRGRRGQAMAIASFGITCGSIVLPPLAVALIVGLGWRDAYRVLGLAVLVLVLPLALLLGRRSGGNGSEEAQAAQGPRGPRALRPSRRLPRLTLPTARARRLLLVLAAPPLLMTAVIFHATALLGERGLSLAQAGAALSLIGVGSVGGTLLAGALADRTSSRTLLSLMAALLTVATLLLVLPTAPPAYLAFALLGAGGGVFGVAAGIVWPRTYGLAEIGRIQGASFSVQIAAAAAGPLPLALSLAATGSFTPALLALACYGALALAVAARWREPRIVRSGGLRR